MTGACRVQTSRHIKGLGGGVKGSGYRRYRAHADRQDSQNAVRRKGLHGDVAVLLLPTPPPPKKKKKQLVSSGAEAP